MISEINTSKLLLISIKPQYAQKIFDGTKSIELRKSAPIYAGKDSLMLIYVTTPVRELWGVCKIKNILKSTPENLWKKCGEKTGISKSEFDEYFGINPIAVGIELTDIKRISKPRLSLEILKESISGFIPPQTYAYIQLESINNSTLRNFID